MNDKVGIERDIVIQLNPSLKWEDFEILNKLNQEYDLLGITDFKSFIFEENLNSIISRIICDWLPYHVIANRNFPLTEVARYDSESNSIVMLSDEFKGGYYIKEQIKKMNELLNHGESKV